MQRFSTSCLLSFATIAAMLALNGCSMDSVTSSPVSDEPVTEVQMAPISGSDYGGHAPLVGAHMYLVQPGTGGYGSVVKGLLTATSNNASFPTTQNGNWTNSGYGSDQFVPAADANGNPFYGVLADSSGSYNLSGDYTCTVGKPVILIGYGGSPSYVGQGSGTTGSTQTNTFAINNATVTPNNTNPATFTFTYTTTMTELFYPGEAVTVTGYTGLNLGYNESGTVLSSGLTTNTFSISVGTSTNLGSGTKAGSTTAPATVVANPPFNPAAVNMAVLGNCPSSGNFSTAGNGAISYIYMNEISATAAAYAFAGFINTAATDQTGNDEFHIGASNSTQGQQGLANAAITAGLLYDIQGSSQTTGAAGEGHIARSVTPNGGFGTVPLETIDTIGNILAACVDSTNTYRALAGTVSSACNVLESTAQDNGVVDGSTIKTSATSHVAFNIAQAAFNIARFPQGAGTGTTNSSGVTTVSANNATTAASYVSTLYGLPTGNVPFTPNLVSPRSGVTGGKPNDFSIALLWNLGAGVSASDVEIDGTGNAWVNAGPNDLYEITPSAVLTNIQTNNPLGETLSSALSAGLAIDSAGFIYAAASEGDYLYAPPVSGALGKALSTSASGIALDNVTNASNGPYQYIANQGDTQPATIVKQTFSGQPDTTAGTQFPIAGDASAANYTPGACAYAVGFITLDSANNVWTATSNNAGNDVPAYVCRFDNLGNLKYSFKVPKTNPNEAGVFAFPRGLAVDNGDNAFFPEKNLDALYLVAQGTVNVTTRGREQNGAYANLTILPGQLSAPSWVAVDGANTIWVSNTGDAGASTGGKPGTGLVQFTDAGAVMTSAYLTGAPLLTSPTTCLTSVAIDPSGNIWSAEGTGQGTCLSANYINEYVGLAAPTRTPISVAKGNSGVGVKP
jgi:hypothetical protein